MAAAPKKPTKKAAASAKKAPAAKKAASKKPAKKDVKKLPTAKEMEKLRQQDKGYELAATDAMEFLQGRRQAVFNIARGYHLDPEDLFQEGYEILLTCLRDFTPVYEKKDGSIVSVQFTTFFGSRMDMRAMELRNGNPEYQARQAYTDSMDADERERFKSDPPLLVQHLDQETAMQEALRGEASTARSDMKGDTAIKIARDSFFERKLSELVSREKDEKKRAALLHVKVGGVYNFQEIAYHFGVTDSRASQVMNELMDAFYVQRLLDASLSSVAYDFKKLKFNEKRCMRLLEEALSNAPKERAEAILETFRKDYPNLPKMLGAPAKTEKAIEEKPATPTAVMSRHAQPPAYEEIFSEEEEKDYPLVGVEVRKIDELTLVDAPMRTPISDADEEIFRQSFNADQAGEYPALITEQGWIIDGERRIAAAKEQGKDDYLCIVRQVPDEAAAKLLRVQVNLRLSQPNKLDLYYAICTLADLGMSQQKIADAIGLSRTNVLVYCKVKDKAAPKLRALFEDGHIQITNAATCVDLSLKAQNELSDFIRKYGQSWSKGTKFNDVFAAVGKGKLAKLEADLEPVAPEPAPIQVVEADSEMFSADGAMAKALQQRVEYYEQSLRDGEVWISQRERVISQQAEVLSEAQQEIEMLKKELEAADLVKFGDKKTLETELKKFKDYFRFTERLSGAAHALKYAAKELDVLDLQRKQMLEINDLYEAVDEELNKLRLTLHNRGLRRTERGTPPKKDSD
jgi:ParB-like chromosome segregation protein Spo0J